MSSRRAKVEAAILASLLAILGAEFLVVHALIEHALKNGQTALEILRELAEEGKA